jgi:ribosomal protein L11 methyltransferase
MKMDRIWKKLILRIKDESYREQVYWWFQDQKPYGFWEKDSLTIVAYVRDWPEESFPEYIVAAERDEEPDENWAKEWRKRFKPIVVNETIVIRPPWEPAIPSKIDLVIYPAYAFGTGDHPTTFSCMEFISQFFKPGMEFLDVGMGSGILSLLAFRLGAGDITSIDIDPLAMEELKRNCALNQIPFERIKSKIGDLTGIEGSFDFIVANIGAQFFLENLPLLSNMLHISGYLVLSGFQGEDVPLIQQKALLVSLEIIQSIDKNNWVTIVYQKRAKNQLSD